MSNGKKMCVSKIKLCPARRSELKSSKIKSLKKKYIAIPEEHKSFYPNFDNVSSADEEIIPKKRKRKRKRKSKVPEKKRRVGRPAKPKPQPVPFQNSILSFFSAINPVESKLEFPNLE